MHTQPHNQRPALSLAEARHFERHHLEKAHDAVLTSDGRMARFRQMRADYLRAAIQTGTAK